MSNYGSLKLPECYIYLYHTDEYFILPQYPESLSDTMMSNFGYEDALSRTAPTYSYKSSGPRSTSISLNLHRDMMREFNCKNARIQMNEGNSIINSIGESIASASQEDYVDILARKLQAIALPRFNASTSMVQPPKVAVCFGNTFFIKGVITSGINIRYHLPILSNNKYAQVSIDFTVTEVTPYDADSIGRLGSFRGLTSSLKSKIDSIAKKG